MGKDHDDYLLERLLDGRLPADDVPQDLAGAGRLLAAARAVPPVDPVVARATVAAMVEVVHSSSQPTPLSRRSPVLAGLLTTKAAVVAAVLTLSATGAAAATGSVPDPVVAFLDDVGIHVPANPVKAARATTSSTTAPPTSTSSTVAGGVGTTDDGENHGTEVSGVARSTEPGPCHGKVVSEAARDHDPDRDGARDDDRHDRSTASSLPTSTTVDDDDRRRGPCPTSTVVGQDGERRHGDDRDRDDRDRDGRDEDADPRPADDRRDRGGKGDRPSTTTTAPSSPVGSQVDDDADADNDNDDDDASEDSSP